ncbi:MAG TPA: phosphatidate cytidylyltransferase [Candidatus Limnocylindrales bacterium]|nr:phosphatidate cytidylyltransferase [Candidatus Limnocylindrales bacterium]
MRQRLISAAVLVPVVAFVFLVGQPWLSVGIALLGVMAAWETARLVHLAGLPAFRWLAISAPVLGVLAFETILRPGGIELGWLLIPPALAIWSIAAAAPALANPDPKNGFLVWVGTLFAGLFPALIAFLAGIAVWGYGSVLPGESEHQTLFNLDLGRHWLLVLIATVWTFDSFAYLSGKFFGRGRFMYHISPAKTWSGVIGGTIAAMVVCGALFLVTGLSPLWGGVLGIALALSGQAGDLAESMLKRAAAVKDSGRILPGHGGFLDRVDSFLFAAPTLYAAVTIAALLQASGGTP